MAMWFAHLHFADRAAAVAGADPHELGWGALCCDVDKFTPVSRELSHYGREGLDFPPEQWGSRTGLDPETLRRHRVFLAGYLSHMALDEAWYGWLLGQLRVVATQGWEGDTTKAWNLAMDRELRPGLRSDWAFPFGVEGVLPHLRGAPGLAMRQAALAYVSWDGSAEARGQHPLMARYVRTMHQAGEAQLERVDRLMRAGSSASLFEACEAFVNDAVLRFLATV